MNTSHVTSRIDTGSEDTDLDIGGGAKTKVKCTNGVREREWLDWRLKHGEAISKIPTFQGKGILKGRKGILKRNKVERVHFKEGEYEDITAEHDNKVSGNETLDKPKCVKDKMQHESTTGRDKVESEILNMREKVQTEKTGVKEKVQSEITGVKEKVQREITGVREKVQSEIKGVREKVQSEVTGVRGKVNSDSSNVGAREKVLTEAKGAREKLLNQSIVIRKKVQSETEDINKIHESPVAKEIRQPETASAKEKMQNKSECAEERSLYEKAWSNSTNAKDKAHMKCLEPKDAQGSYETPAAGNISNGDKSKKVHTENINHKSVCNEKSAKANRGTELDTAEDNTEGGAIVVCYSGAWDRCNSQVQEQVSEVTESLEEKQVSEETDLSEQDEEGRPLFCIGMKHEPYECVPCHTDAKELELQHRAI